MTSTSETSSLPPSPLTEVKPESLQELFNTPPLELSDEKVDKIVASLQADRQRFLTAEAAPKAEPKAKKKAADLNLKIEDLDL